jgi:competence protein ComEC
MAMLGLLLPRLAAWMRWLALLLLLGVSGVHLMLQRSDQLLLVQQPGGGIARTLLLARHEGRGALISSRADGLSCRQARRLATAIGVETLDWLLLLDPVAAEEPGCWQKLAGLVVAYGDGSVPLGAQEGIRSRGLRVQALTQDSHALQLQLGGQQWLLLPDRQALRAWEELKQPCPEGVWLGFRPSRSERQAVETGRDAMRWRWWSGPPAKEGAPGPWQASGISGSLQT